MKEDSVVEYRNPGIALPVADVLTEVLRNGARELLQQAVEAEVTEFVRQWDGDKWDLVFLDPPYKTDYLQLLEKLGSSKVVNDDGLLVVEHHHKTELPESVGKLQRTRILKQGDSSLSFYSC